MARINMTSAGVCFGKFTHNGKFRLQITCLDFLAQYAKVCCLCLLCLIVHTYSLTVQSLDQKISRELFCLWKPYFKVWSW